MSLDFPLYMTEEEILIACCLFYDLRFINMMINIVMLLVKCVQIIIEFNHYGLDINNTSFLLESSSLMILLVPDRNEPKTITISIYLLIL